MKNSRKSRSAANQESTQTSRKTRPQHTHKEPRKQFQALNFETRSFVPSSHLLPDAILGWIKYVRDIRAGTGNYKADYERTAQLILFDDANNPIRTINFEGFFPLTLDEASLDGSPQGQVVEVSSTWSYDSYFET